MSDGDVAIFRTVSTIEGGGPNEPISCYIADATVYNGDCHPVFLAEHASPNTRAHTLQKLRGRMARTPRWEEPSLLGGIVIVVEETTPVSQPPHALTPRDVPLDDRGCLAEIREASPPYGPFIGGCDPETLNHVWVGRIACSIDVLVAGEAEHTLVRQIMYIIYALH